MSRVTTDCGVQADGSYDRRPDILMRTRYERNTAAAIGIDLVREETVAIHLKSGLIGRNAKIRIVGNPISYYFVVVRKGRNTRNKHSVARITQRSDAVGGNANQVMHDDIIRRYAGIANNRNAIPAISGNQVTETDLSDLVRGTAVDLNSVVAIGQSRATGKIRSDQISNNQITIGSNILNTNSIIKIS